MKKTTKQSSRPRQIQPLSPQSLEQVSGGGLSGPDQCSPRYRLVCTTDVTPPTTQDT